MIKLLHRRRYDRAKACPKGWSFSEMESSNTFLLQKMEYKLCLILLIHRATVRAVTLSIKSGGVRLKLALHYYMYVKVTSKVSYLPVR